MPISLVAALIALGLGERTFAWVFVGFALLALLFSVGFIGYFARIDPDRLQSEEYQLRTRELKLLYRKGRSPEVIDMTKQVARIESSLPRDDAGDEK